MKIIQLLVLLFLCSNQLFAQRNLSFYVDKAKQNSPLINDNVNLDKANLVEIERLKAFYTKPQIALSATYLFTPILSTDNGKPRFEPNSNGATNYYGYELGATNGGQYLAQLTLTQPLFNSSRSKIASEQLVVASQQNRNLAAISGHDLEKLVTDQYILCQQDLQQIKYADVMAQMLPQQKEIVRKLVEVSIYKQSDLSLLNIEYQNTLGLLSTYKANYRRDLMDLNIMSGINDTTLVALEPADLKLSAQAEHSLFIEKYALDSANLAATQNIFELKYKPQLNFVTNTGLNTNYAPSIPRRFGIGAGLNLTIPIYDGHQRAISRRRTDILMKSVSFSRQNFVNQNTVRKVKILSELQSYVERTTILEQQLQDYESLLTNYKREIVTGQLSIIIYLTTLKNRDIAQRDYTLISGQKQALINAYNYWNW